MRVCYKSSSVNQTVEQREGGGNPNSAGRHYRYSRSLLCGFIITMAQRRMFSQDIVSSDAFLDMPTSSQVLYFHLAMRADDDGFITPKMTMRVIGSGDDDLKVLIAKRFVLVFEGGVVVIKHWLIHNLIRADLYKETLYKKEKSTLGLNENGAYTELRDGVSEIKTTEPPKWLKARRGELRTANVPQTVHRLGKVSIGKVREVEDSKEEASITFLEELSEAVKQSLSEKYAISPRGIQSKATDLTLYCKQNGKKYKNYKAFLENALRKDKRKLQDEFSLAASPSKKEPEPELTPEQTEKNRQIRANIAAMLKK